MHANIPEGKDLRVKVIGNFAVVGNSGNGWTWNTTVVQQPYEVTADFTSTQTGLVDVSLLVNPSGITRIEVYENGDTVPTWTR